VLDVAGGLPEVIVATTAGTSTYYVQIQGQVLAQQDSGAWVYILPDHLGSVRQLVGSDSQVALAQSFDPFGGSFESAGSGTSEFGYTGEWWDAEAALLYLRARYYDPVVGRFVSKDPWQGDSSRPQSLNAWSYVQGNPLNFTDPSGRIVCPYGVDPETGACNPPRWGGSGEGLPPTFAQTLAQTAAADPASATAQVALSVLAYLYFRLADNPQPSPPPLRVGSPWEGLREWLPLGQQPGSLTPGPALGDTPEWLPAVLPGPYLDTPGTTTWVLDFRLIQPCLRDYILNASWKVGDPIDQDDAHGQYPSWETVRERYWKNRAHEAAWGEFSRQNIGRMKVGYPPQVRIITRNRNTGELAEKLVSKELHHIGGRSGGRPHASGNLKEMWPWEHEQIDASRYLDYDFVRFK
jgi:RHS repeat-associated protein